MPLGKVKWFDNAKGFGFIVPLEGGQDVFVHHKEIQMSGFRTLKEGETVEFELAKGPKGLNAKNVRPAGGGAPEGASGGR